MSCKHLRQTRLPCATPGCQFTITQNEITAKVITAKGRRKGWTYEVPNCVPESYQAPVIWKREMTGMVRDESKTAQMYFWVPAVQVENVSFSRCFNSFIPLFCPNEGAMISKSKIYKNGLSVIAHCPACNVRWRPKLDGENVRWTTQQGEYAGENAAVPILEYHE